MNWQPAVAERLGPLGRPRPLGASAWTLTAGDQRVVVKVGPGVADEAAGLRALAGVEGAPPVPEVLVVDDGVLVSAWVDGGQRAPSGEEGLGRSLAALHAARADSFGGGSHWVGACPVEPDPRSDAVAFYGARLAGLAARCELQAPVAAAVTHLDQLIPPGPPAILHGDLWWGNVVWGADGRAWLIDPSVHGGHPEEDLAMLALFGGLPDRLVAAYRECRPLDDGWEDRVALWQLYPLLVHAVLFGGGYRERAAAFARRYARP